jgi:hypothetical protein
MIKSSKSEPIEISIDKVDNLVSVSSPEETFEIHNYSSILANTSRMDFAVWLFLPIAMVQGRNIVVQGAGSEDTIKNAQALSRIWEAWMPEKFTSVSISFTETYTGDKPRQETLSFYSGGVDSTYSLLKRSQKGLRQSLLTVHGMDYKHDDSERFEKLKNKTRKFSEMVGDQRLFVRSNVYDVYDKYKINSKNSHITHIFALAGISFLFSEQFSKILISADYRLDQQFAVHPWGSNSFTNNYFDDGLTRLFTIDDDVTRIEKLPTLMNSDVALNALTFCVDYKSRPENCGVCSKCMRTKLMFFIVTGKVPNVFKSMDMNKSIVDTIKLTKPSERAFFIDLYQHARANDRLKDIPYLEDIFVKIKDGSTSTIKDVSTSTIKDVPTSTIKDGSEVSTKNLSKDRIKREIYAIMKKLRL